MKITVTIRPDHLSDVGDVFELRQEGYDAPLFLTTIGQPVVVTFEDGNRSFHVPLEFPWAKARAESRKQARDAKARGENSNAPGVKHYSPTSQGEDGGPNAR